MPSITGTVYQAWRSIEGWLRLTNPDHVIYVEGAEDFDLVAGPDATAVQVKHTEASISLGTEKGREALQNFWDIVLKNPGMQVEFHYVTTARVAMEKDAAFGGVTGIDAWRIAQTNIEYAEKIRAYLLGKLDSKSTLKAFLATSSLETVQTTFIRRFHWFTQEPNIDVVKRSVSDRVAAVLAGQRRSTAHSERVQKYLESRYWEVVVRPNAADRVLTLGELLRQIESATTAYIPVPLEKLADFVIAHAPAHALLALLAEKAPKPPEPLLRRLTLTQRLEQVVEQRRSVLLTGSVHKGKTTIAQLVASKLCPTALWISLSGRAPEQVDSLLLAIAARVDRDPEFPALLVLDDLDTIVTAQRIYSDALSLLIHRLKNSGRGVILTARGSSGDTATFASLPDVERIEIPEVGADELRGLCIEYGCPPELAPMWAALIALGTAGHPKLVQIQIAEARSRGWPKPTADDLTKTSAGVSSAKQGARRMVAESLPPQVAEFVYTLSECSTLIDRPTAIRLGESISDLVNAGDVLDSLVGKWLEQITGVWIRATPLLKGVAAEAWSESKRKLAHSRIYDSIQKKSPLDPAEAAALLFHAYFGGDARRVALTAMKLQLIKSSEAKREVERNLLWLPYVALDAGNEIVKEPLAAASLRSLQFRVATTLESDTLPQICDRWIEEVARIPIEEAREISSTLLWHSIGGSESSKVPIRVRLRAIAAVSSEAGTSLDITSAGIARVFGAIDRSEVPDDGTVSQMFFLCAARCVHNAESLTELTEWLDNEASASARTQFDAMLEWPLVQGLGAFVQGAWAANHETETDWKKWMAVLDQVSAIALRHNMPRLGRESAKAKSILLTEYLGSSEGGLAALDEGERVFGESPILSAQRANVYFQTKDDAKVLEIWDELTGKPANAKDIDVFVYRRAATSAARLSKWSMAAAIFLAAIESRRTTSPYIRFGFQIEAALCLALDGNYATSNSVLFDAVADLPEEAKRDGNAQWEAILRAASEVCRRIEELLGRAHSSETRVEVGYTSTPGLSVSKLEPGQEARGQMLLASATKLGACVAIKSERLRATADELSRSSYWAARWYAREAKFSLGCAELQEATFLPAFLAFVAGLQSLKGRDRSASLVAPDGGADISRKAEDPEQFWSLLVLGCVCAGPSLVSSLENWIAEAQRQLGTDAPLVKSLEELLAGASIPRHLLYASFATSEKTTLLRCGAAAMYLVNPEKPRETLQAQLFLLSAIFSGGAEGLQALFNMHLARRFAPAWKRFAEQSFQLSTPRTSVPLLRACVERIESGRGTLRSLLSCAAEATAVSIPDFAKVIA